MIVKAQVSLATDDGCQRALIYSEDHGVRYETADQREVQHVQRKLAGRLRGFFRARLVRDMVDLLEQVEEQGW